MRLRNWMMGLTVLAVTTTLSADTTQDLPVHNWRDFVDSFSEQWTVYLDDGQLPYFGNNFIVVGEEGDGVVCRYEFEPSLVMGDYLDIDGNGCQLKQRTYVKCLNAERGNDQILLSLDGETWVDLAKCTLSPIASCIKVDDGKLCLTLKLIPHPGGTTKDEKGFHYSGGEPDCQCSTDGQCTVQAAGAVADQ